MAALTGDRNTPRVNAHQLVRRFPVSAGVTIHAGAQIVINAGFAEPATATTGLTAVGRAEERVDNSGGANGDLDVDVLFDIFRWANSAGGDEITLSDIGATVYAVDDQTVALTDGTSTRSPAGTVFDVETGSGVWVKPSA